MYILHSPEKIRIRVDVADTFKTTQKHLPAFFSNILTIYAIRQAALFFSFSFFCRICAEVDTWNHLHLYFFCVRLRNSAITPASPLTQKSTTLRWILWWSHYSVAKRQQFSCALSTATLSLKFENVVPEGWIDFSRAISK